VGWAGVERRAVRAVVTGEECVKAEDAVAARELGEVGVSWGTETGTGTGGAAAGNADAGNGAAGTESKAIG